MHRNRYNIYDSYEELKKIEKDINEKSNYMENIHYKPYLHEELMKKDIHDTRNSLNNSMNEFKNLVKNTDLEKIIDIIFEKRDIELFNYLSDINITWLYRQFILDKLCNDNWDEVMKYVIYWPRIGDDLICGKCNKNIEDHASDAVKKWLEHQM